jgi:hypothetical protein
MVNRTLEQPIDDLCGAAYAVIFNRMPTRPTGVPKNHHVERAEDMRVLYDALIAIRSPWLAMALQLGQPE